MIDTATFQRLRHIKELGLAHTVYPNATHTRFAHSLGVLAIMSRVLRTVQDQWRLSDEIVANLRLGALLHDVGHYPYSHLPERLLDVQLIEEQLEQVSGKGEIAAKKHDPYPKHENLGERIVTTQEDLIDAIGGKERSQVVADMLTGGKAADAQLSKLIHSSLDMDRLDYLVRDAKATGVPYGEIDINYLVNNVRASKSGILGIKAKALIAAEQFLLARFFMYRAVYYHKTVLGFEEAFRQLLRRCRDQGKYGVPPNGSEVWKIVTDRRRFLEFTDHYLDAVARKALEDKDRVIARLARTVVHRIRPALLREACSLINQTVPDTTKHNACISFMNRCREKLRDLAGKHNIDLKLFMLVEPGQLRLEKRGSLQSFEEVENRAKEKAKKKQEEQPSQEFDELIKVFPDKENEEPKSLVDIPHSIIGQLSNHTCRIVRLYVIEEDERKIEDLRQEVRSWPD